LTNWTGFSIAMISATADGKRLVFIKIHDQFSIYVASLGKSEKSGLGTVERLTTDTWEKALNGWTLDSRGIYFSLHRNGKTAIYRQDLHQQSPERMISGIEDVGSAHLSPDGSLLLYTALAKRGSSELNRVMSMPVEGGTPLELARGDYGYQCAVLPSASCILSEVKGKTLNFYPLDPKSGPATQPIKTISNTNASDLNLYPESWSLSPDGQYIALVQGDDKGQVQIFNLRNDTVRRLDLITWTHLETVSWSPDGRTLYVTSFGSQGATLLSVSLNGNAKSLFQGHNWLCCPKVAPSGRLLAFLAVETQSDASMLKDF